MILNHELLDTISEFGIQPNTIPDGGLQVLDGREDELVEERAQRGVQFDGPVL